jgi:hypothetical protein
LLLQHFCSIFLFSRRTTIGGRKEREEKERKEREAKERKEREEKEAREKVEQGRREKEAFLREAAAFGPREGGPHQFLRGPHLFLGI